MSRTSAVVAVLAWLAVPMSARGQFLTNHVVGAQLRASYFQATYQPGPGQSWSALQGHLVHVYRATIDEGTITLGATLAANTAPRTALGPSSSQTLSIEHNAGSVWADSDFGTPSQQLEVEIDLPWDKSPTIFSYPLVLAYDVEVGNLYATCGNVYGCTVKSTILVLPARAAIAIGGVERSVPTLLSRQTTFVDLASAGISPFAEWESIALDGVAMTKVPFMANYAVPPVKQWYRHPVRAGDVAQSGDPLPPTGLVIPSSNESIEKFLSCGGGGCGTHQARIGFAGLPTGLHTLTLHTRPYASGTYSYYQSQANVGAGLADDTSDLTTQFIIFGPQTQVTPTEAGPGQAISVTGSGFAPNSKVRFTASIASSSRYAVIGTADTDVTGSFEATPTLPPTGDVFFTDVIQSGPRTGAIQVDVDDEQFLDDYFQGVPQYAGAQMTYVPVATATTTTTLPTTSTTLPGGGSGDVGIDDTPSCAAVPVPAKAVEKFDSANQGMDVIEQMILEAAARKSIRKAIGKVDTALGAVRRLVNRAKKKGIIPEGCAVEAFGLIEDLRNRAREAKQSLKN